MVDETINKRPEFNNERKTADTDYCSRKIVCTVWDCAL
jgi:hypothetical protein